MLLIMFAICSSFFVFLFQRHILEARLVTAVSLHPHDYIPIKECFWATVENVSFLFHSYKFHCLLYTGCFKVLAGPLPREKVYKIPLDLVKIQTYLANLLSIFFFPCKKYDTLSV